MINATAATPKRSTSGKKRAGIRVGGASPGQYVPLNAGPLQSTSQERGRKNSLYFMRAYLSVMPAT